jgi:hypothetical protein
MTNKRSRGAIKSPRHRLAGAKPHVVTAAAPPQFIMIPAKLSMWLNQIDGDCTVAEEAFAKACCYLGSPSGPEIFITDDTVQTWGTANGFMNGAVIIDVIDAMQTNGFVQDGNTYCDGEPISVDWTDAGVLENAIATNGPVKIGVAADQLETAVGDTQGNGWFATGFKPDADMDHCVSLCGYGTLDYLATELGVGLPLNVDGTLPGYALFTWSSIGIIDVPSVLAITSEAWVRNPTTIIR